MGNGDGTVNMRSLLGCEMWKNSPAQGKHAVHQHVFSGVEHYNILGNAEIIDYILKTLTGKGTKSHTRTFNQHSRNEKIMKIRLF